MQNISYKILKELIKDEFKHYRMESKTTSCCLYPDFLFIHSLSHLSEVGRGKETE